MIHTNNVILPECRKYEEMWSVDQYREYSPGEDNIERFLSVIQPLRGDNLVDIGCGEGMAGIKFQENGLIVHWVDVTDSALSPIIDRNRFIQSSLWERRWSKKRIMGWDYGYCCDVLEHIPTEFVMLSLYHIINNCRTSWLQISFEPDSFGILIGQPLHLTVQSFTWWRDRISSVGRLVEARDLCGHGLFVVKQ